MLGIQPYISFKGNCEEAVNFYADRLGGEVVFMQRYGESPMAGKGPDDKIMHCTVKIGESAFMGCDNVFEDTNPTTIGNNISLTIGTKDVDEAERAFERLSEGATIVMPMQETFWAQRFGMLTDKFGINWMINCEKAQMDQAAAG